MDEQLTRIEGVFTYTFDQFTVFFYGDHVYIGGREFPIGQSTVDVMNLDEAVLDELDQRAREFIPAAQTLFDEKTDSAALAQERLNAVWDVLFTLPVYRDLPMDQENSYHLFERLMADREKWTQMSDSTSEGYVLFQGMLASLLCLAERLRGFRQQVDAMARQYFEPLKRRKAGDYAGAYSFFYANMLTASAQLSHELFQQSFPMEVSFVPMQGPAGHEQEIFIAEKATFNSLTDFLRTEFYRGLAIGNAPRPCHNCGRYFLLTAGYNTCYCNNIAPGETERTCRKVGAHRKEAQGRANRTPAQKEYDRAYVRLKQRKLRGKISVDEWNTAVAKAQELVAQSEHGKLTDEELTRKLKEL